MNVRDLFNTSRPLAALLVAGLLGATVQTALILKAMGGHVAWSIADQKEAIAQQEASELERIERDKMEELARLQQQHAERARLMQEQAAQQSAEQLEGLPE